MSKSGDLIKSIEKNTKEKQGLLRDLSRSLALQELVPDVFEGPHDDDGMLVSNPRSRWSNPSPKSRVRGHNGHYGFLWPDNWALKVTKADGSVVDFVLADEMPISDERLELFERVSSEVEQYKVRRKKKGCR